MRKGYYYCNAVTLVRGEVYAYIGNGSVIGHEAGKGTSMLQEFLLSEAELYYLKKSPSVA